MNLFPTIGLYLLSGGILVLPILMIRLGLARTIHKEALERLSFFPQEYGIERYAQGVYFVVNTALLFTPVIFKLESPLYLLIPGLIIYLAGVLLLLLSTVSFSKGEGYVSSGIYQYSRNPMYISYFLMFIGIGLCINSILFIILVFINQIAIHFLIISEERWCHSFYPDEYDEHSKKVKRYFGKPKDINNLS